MESVFCRPLTRCRRVSHSVVSIKEFSSTLLNRYATKIRNVVNFVGVQCEVTRGPEEEQPKRGRKRPVELLSSLTGKVFNPRKGR